MAAVDPTQDSRGRRDATVYLVGRQPVDEAALDRFCTDRTLRRKRARPAARGVLPKATGTKLFVSSSARALRHFIEMRAGRHAEVAIRKLAVQVLRLMRREAPHRVGDDELLALPDGTLEAVPLALPSVTSVKETHAI